jgi:hypothetical protein
VRNNLHSFLQTARRKFPGILLWIDAISIDQGNDEEKGKQVCRMADIYHMAFKTLIWPSDNRGLDLALRLITGVKRRRLSRDDFDDLARLYTDPYWKRAWIGQEIIPSRALLIHTAHKWCYLDTIVWISKNCSMSDSVALESE